MEGKTMEKLGAAIVLLEQTRKKLQKAQAAYSDALVVLQERDLPEEVSYLRGRWPEVEIVDYGISTFVPESAKTWVDRLVDARFDQSETTRFEMMTLAGATPDEAITALIDQRRRNVA
jgi:hypothetical protein